MGGGRGASNDGFNLWVILLVDCDIGGAIWSEFGRRDLDSEKESPRIFQITGFVMFTSGGQVYIQQSLWEFRARSRRSSRLVFEWDWIKPAPVVFELFFSVESWASFFCCWQKHRKPRFFSTFPKEKVEQDIWNCVSEVASPRIWWLEVLLKRGKLWPGWLLVASEERVCSVKMAPVQLVNGLNYGAFLSDNGRWLFVSGDLSHWKTYEKQEFAAAIFFVDLVVFRRTSANFKEHLGRHRSVENLARLIVSNWMFG